MTKEQTGGPLAQTPLNEVVAAAAALGWEQREAIERAVHANLYYREELIETLAGICEAPVAMWVLRNWFVGRDGDTESIELFDDLVRHSDDQQVAAWVFVDTLASLFRVQATWLVHEVLQGLGDLAVSPAGYVLRAKNPPCRDALIPLAARDPACPDEVFAALLDDPDDAVRAAASQALAGRANER